MATQLEISTVAAVKSIQTLRQQTTALNGVLQGLSKSLGTLKGKMNGVAVDKLNKKIEAQAKAIAQLSTRMKNVSKMSAEFAKGQQKAEQKVAKLTTKLLTQQKATDKLTEKHKKALEAAKKATVVNKQTAASMIKMKNASASAGIQFKSLVQKLKLVGAENVRISNLRRSVEALDKKLKTGALTPTQYANAMNRWKASMSTARREIDKLKNAQTKSNKTMKIGVTRLRAVTRAARQNKKEINGASTAYKNLGSSAIFAVGPLSGIGARLTAFSAIAGRSNKVLAITAIAIVSVGVAIFKFTAGLVKARLQIDSTMNALQVATGSLTDAQVAFRFVSKSVLQLGTDLKGSLIQFGQLSAAARGTSLAGEGVRKIFASVSKAAVVLGLSADATSGAFRALQQMISKGKVQAEELRGQLGERLPGAFQLAAKAMGVTSTELNKMLELGQVLAEDLLPKLAIELDKVFGDQSAIASKSLLSAFNRLGAAIDIFFIEIESRIALGEKFARIIDKISGGVQAISPNRMTEKAFARNQIEQRALESSLRGGASENDPVKPRGRVDPEEGFMADVNKVRQTIGERLITLKKEENELMQISLRLGLDLKQQASERLAEIGRLLKKQREFNAIKAEAAAKEEFELKRMEKLFKKHNQDRFSAIKAQDKSIGKGIEDIKKAREAARQANHREYIRAAGVRNKAEADAEADRIKTIEDNFQRQFTEGLRLTRRAIKIEAKELLEMRKAVENDAARQFTERLALQKRAMIKEAREIIARQKAVSDFALKTQKFLMKAKKAELHKEGEELERLIKIRAQISGVTTEAADLQRVNQARVDGAIASKELAIQLEFENKVRSFGTQGMIASNATLMDSIRAKHEALAITKELNEEDRKALSLARHLEKLRDKFETKKTAAGDELEVMNQSNIILQMRIDGMNEEADAMELRNKLEEKYGKALEGTIAKIIAATAENEALKESLGRVMEVKTAISDGFKQMGSDIASGIREGKNLVDILINSFGNLLERLLEIAIQLLIIGPLLDALKLPGGNGGTDSLGAITSIASSFAGSFASKKGNIFQGGGVTPFRQGGVVNQPSNFGFNGGIGSIAEDGPEGILPLKRGTSGKLGVEASGMGAPTVIFQLAPGTNVREFNDAQPQIAATIAGTMAAASASNN